MRRDYRTYRAPFSTYNQRYPNRNQPQIISENYGKENGWRKPKQNQPQIDLQKPKTPQELSSLSNYQIAKYYENNISCRNLDKALEFYLKALKTGEKRDSTIKDLSGVLHQMGKTQEAVEFLNQNKKIYRGDLNKYQNLVDNFKKQIELPSGKNMNRFILVLAMGRESSREDFLNLFSNSTRIVSIKLYKDLSFTELATQNDLPHGLVEFPSYSAAKKTMESFKFLENPYVELYWVNIHHLLICEIKKGEDDPFQLNTCYFGSNNGFDRLFNFIDTPPPTFQETYKEINLFTQSQFKKKDIRKIWSNPKETQPPYPSPISKRIGFENSIKLQLIRNKKLFSTREHQPPHINAPHNKC